MRPNTTWLIGLFACLMFALACVPAMAGEGHGIEKMTGSDWKGMWGFEKRGFSECWLAGSRHQAALSLASLDAIEARLGNNSPAAATIRAERANLQALLRCQVTPSQLESGVDAFYKNPANGRVLLGDALHQVVMARARGAIR